ncbi:hypothetical protein OXX79_003302 [Metschnikowia pulcherrima]
MSTEHPSVYIATYSNTDVYECLVGDAPIMRRCKDNWANATQILKLCNFPKAKRTKILERGVQQGLHEKVQGGYGRFQGTWIPLEAAQKLATDHEIAEETVPVLFVDVNDPKVKIPRKTKGTGAKDNTPSKRKYVRKTGADVATPKKMRLEDQLPPQAVFTQVQPHPPQRTGSNVAHNGVHAPPMAGPPQQMRPVPMPVPEFGPAFSRQYPQFALPESTFAPQAPVFAKQNYGPPADAQGVFPHRATPSHSTNETNWSQEEHTRDSDTSISSGDPKVGAQTHDEDRSYVSQIVRFFSEESAPIPYFLYNPPPDFNIDEAIDNEGHSTLHWAVSLGNLNLVHLLLSKHANPLVVNHSGQNPLSKSISFNNCYDMKNFPHIVDALEVCLINTDVNGRTPLHYLCISSKLRQKLPALTYYASVIIQKLRLMARSSDTGVDLFRNVIDHQDVNGDTCLHLAARAGCTHLVKILIEIGARDDLHDLTNHTARQLVIQLGLVYNAPGPFNVSQKQAGPFGVPHPGHYQGSQKQGYESQQNNSVPVFHVTASHTPEQGEHKEVAGLGTPIRGFGRLAETPDTQRTTVQEDVDELHDRVSAEHLASLSQQQAGTVDDNKENIFVDEHKYGASTPKNNGHNDVHDAQGNKAGILGVLSEKEGGSESADMAAKKTGSHSPRPEEASHSAVEGNTQYAQKDVRLPMKDVASMVQGMMNSLSTSYEEQISGLKGEQERVREELEDKKAQNQQTAARVRGLLERHGFENAHALADADMEVVSASEEYAKDLKQKEAQLQNSLGRWHAFELAALVESHEGEIAVGSEIITSQEKWALARDLSQAQVKRRQLAGLLATRICDFAINAKMNKYRKLISLSCGLRVEDIDGLIDGIEASLTEGSMQA